MKLLSLIFLSLTAFAQTPLDLCKIAEAEGKREATELFRLPPTPEQKIQIDGIAKEILGHLEKDQELKKDIKAYYQLMELKHGKQIPVEFNPIPGWEEMHGKLPQWKLTESLQDQIKKYEDKVAHKINGHLKSYMLDPKRTPEANPSAIVTSAVTYNETTEENLLFRLLLPVEKNKLLKTNVTFSPDAHVSTSVLFSYAVEGDEVRFHIEDVREHLFTYHVKRNLSKVCRELLYQKKKSTGILDGDRYLWDEDLDPNISAEPPTPRQNSGQQQ